MIEGNVSAGIADCAVPKNEWLGPRKFEDCSEKEKIERLRQEIKGWRRLYSELSGRLALLETHHHSAQGVLLVDLKQMDAFNRMNQCAQAYETL